MSNKVIRKQDSNVVILATPWRDPKDCRLTISNAILSELVSNSIGTPSENLAEAFVKERTRLHGKYIHEREVTQRIGMIVGAGLVLAAAAMVMFAPAGRETLSYWIGAALVIFAAGAMGYKRVWGTSKSISFGADQDERDL